MNGLRLVVASAAAFGLLATSAQAGQLDYPDFSTTDGLQLNGSAATTNDVLRLAPAMPDQAGSAFTVNKPVNTTKKISTKFSFQIHSATGFEPADGFVFAFQNDERGASALGNFGGQLGFGDPNGVTPAVGVAFNVYGNDDRVYFVKNGSTTEIAPAVTALYDAVRYAWVDYSPKKRRLKVYVANTRTKPDTPLTTKKFNLKQILGRKVRAGFTAATGGENAAQDILSWTLKNP